VVEAGLVVRHRRSIHIVLTPAGHEVLERAIAAQSNDHRLKRSLNDDDRALVTVALIKVVASDRSEDNRNRIHVNNVIAHSPCVVGR
jgi:DNA-binding MarR family transcriptional regulator